MVQWYPGHIAKTEKELKDQLKLMDVVIEVRDARIPLSTTHPQVSFFCHLVVALFSELPLSFNFFFFFLSCVS